VAANTVHDTGESTGPAGLESSSDVITDRTTRRTVVTAWRESGWIATLSATVGGEDRCLGLLAGRAAAE
jgi:hypothetical protein